MRDLSASLEAYRQAKTSEMQSLAMASALRSIDRDGLKAITKKLKLFGDGKKALKIRVEMLRSHVKDQKITADDEECVKILTRNIRIHFSVEVADVVCSIASIAADVLLFVPTVPVACLIAAAVIYTACAVESLFEWVLTNLLLNTSPFDPSSKSPLIWIVDSMVTKVQGLWKRIKTLTIADDHCRLMRCFE
jgi:hypothetical protein